MAASQAANVSELTVLVEGIVEQILGRKLDGHISSWVGKNRQVDSRLSYQRDSNNERGSQALGSIVRLGTTISNVESSLKNYSDRKELKGSGMPDFGTALFGAVGVVNAYKNGDPLGGAMSGAAFGPWGAAIGFLAGLFGGPEEIDKWDKPKFRKADKAYDKLFTMDRGEEELYNLPESFYFRTGWTSRKLIVHIGNNQFDDYMRDSITNSYDTQLQQGVVL